MKREHETRHDYKVIVSELGISPIQMIRSAFALMGLIPLLILVYIIVGKYFLYELFLGTNGLIVGVAVFISAAGK